MYLGRDTVTSTYRVALVAFSKPSRIDPCSEWGNEIQTMFMHIGRSEIDQMSITRQCGASYCSSIHLHIIGR